MPTHKTVTITLDLPVLDEATAAQVYNALCTLVDRFDAHYGEQICHFYRARDALAQQSSRPDPFDSF